jgi:hypothetical protein
MRFSLFVLLLAAACTPSKPTEYAADLAICDQVAMTCDAYVACRQSVEKKYGKTFNGTCEHAPDAGAAPEGGV